MRVLLTGAAGQLAGDLAPGLTAEGMEVTALAKSGLDITDAERVMKVVRETSPGVIVNAAAYTQVDRAESAPDTAFAVNSLGAANLADAASEVGATLVHVSTDFVFDGAKRSPYVEGDPTAPLGVYGASKLAGEVEITERLAHHVIVRASWLYGAEGNNFVKTILRLARERETISVVSDQTGTPTWTADLASALTEVVKRLSGTDSSEVFGLYHYSPGGEASWYDFAVEIVRRAEALGARFKCREVKAIPTSEYPTPARRPAYSVLDHTRFAETFGVDVPDWRDSLGRMLAGIIKKEGECDG